MTRSFQSEESERERCLEVFLNWDEELTMKLLLTGATGFIGQAVTQRIVTDAKYSLTVAVRSTTAVFSDAVSVAQIADLTSETDWVTALSGVDVVVHLAARAHVLKETYNDPLVEFRRTNVEAALAFAKQALHAGVKRFVFISSIGVNGSRTLDFPFSELSLPDPHADYAISKFEAEQALLALLKDASMELVIIRPPLVYAGHAPGNFSRLLKLVASGIPLPFGSVRNQRSMVALENLADFIVLCADHPAAGNKLFLISDGVDFSISEIVKYLAEGMSKKVRLLTVPVSLMRLGAGIVGKQHVFEQLCGSLVIDSSKARNLLGWHPPLKADDALRKAGRDGGFRH